MNPVAARTSANGSLLAQLYAPIAEDLARAEELFQGSLRSRHPYVDELAQYGCLLGGKRLRPALLLLTASAVGGVRPEHHTLAAVVEMIHTATLIHDDVLDEADMRRHLATVNHRWNTESSVLLAFSLASTLETTYACRMIGRSTNIVCEGELRQVGGRGDFTLSEQEYFEIIDAKTAELCACACRLGAYYAQAEAAVVEGMAEYGRSLGIAFQVADDLLDLLGDEEKTGKSLGTDLEKQKLTLPVIRALEQAEGTQQAEILHWLENPSPEHRRRLREHIAECGALEYARTHAARHAARARDLAAELQPGPAAQILAALSDFVIERSF